MTTVVQLHARTLRPAAGQPDGQRAVYTVKEVAQLLSLSLGSTYTLVRDGTIPARRMGGRWVIPRQRFHDWLNDIAGPDPVSATGTDHHGRRR